MKIPLPIDPLLPDALTAIEAASTLIVQASPGSGKTTRLAPYFLRNSNLLKDSQIWVLEPRRLAAQFAAIRVAEEEKEKIGEWVGYQFRFEKKYSNKTQLLFLTEGMLLRRLLSNPNLLGVGMVVLDEFHERHLQTDLSLSFLRHLQKTTRPDLKIVVMSATLEINQLITFLPDAKTLQLETPLFPVVTHHLAHTESTYTLARKIRQKIELYFSKSESGDCLVFLPGLKEIREAETELFNISKKLNIEVLGLHGDFAKEEQEKALAPCQRRKVILSTNLAETSLTIPGVNCVIDSGLQRTASFSWWTGVPTLSTKSNSKASAIQRAGRAGRTGPGFCFRLYTQHEFETKPAFDIPEIRRAELAQTVLELKAMGIRSFSEIDWFESPSVDALASAYKLLYQLGALDSFDSKAQITPLGHQMSAIGVHPRISRFLIECKKHGCLDDGLSLASLISENKFSALEAIENLKKPLDRSSLRIKSHLAHQFSETVQAKEASDQAKERALALSLLTAFPDRIAQAKDLRTQVGSSLNATREFVLAAGGTAVLGAGVHYSYDLKEPFVIALSLQETTRKEASAVFLKSLVPIHEEWIYELNPCPIEERHKTFWNKEKQRAQSVSELLIGQLVLESREREVDNEAISFKVIIREFFKTDPEKLEEMPILEWLSLLGSVFPREQIEVAFSKLQLWVTHSDKNEAMTSIALKHFLETWLHGKRSREQILSPKFFELLKETFCEGKIHLFEKFCPSEFTFPNQRTVNIHYGWNVAPWIESKMQDFFGLKEVPRICGGRVKLTAHLLAPNFRAVQVTSDLDNFWKTHYPGIRKELCRNYPKHPWPENPYIPLPAKPRRKV